MEDDASLLSELLRHMPSDVRARPPEERRAWLRRAATHVREQRRQEQSARAFRAAVAAEYRPSHPELLAIAGWGTSPPGALTPMGPGVYGFPLLADEVRSSLLEELASVERWAAERALSIVRPNSMNRYGLILDDIGYSSVLDRLMRTLVVPLAERVYPGIGPLRDHHGFLVEYEPERDTSLALHVDDAEVTLNVCLGETFEGGDLGFSGVRCPDHASSAPAPGESFDAAHQPGWAVLHHGRHRHRAHPLRSGRRINLILWCRTTPRPPLRAGEAPCPPWCGASDR